MRCWTQLHKRLLQNPAGEADDDDGDDGGDDDGEYGGALMLGVRMIHKEADRSCQAAKIAGGCKHPCRGFLSWLRWIPVFIAFSGFTHPGKPAGCCCKPQGGSVAVCPRVVSVAFLWKRPKGGGSWQANEGLEGFGW